MDNQTIQVLLQFLDRVDLKGNEAPALMKAVLALQQLYQRQATFTPPPPPADAIPAEGASGS